MYEPLLICKYFHLDALLGNKSLYEVYKRALEAENIDAVMVIKTSFPKYKNGIAVSDMVIQSD